VARALVALNEQVEWAALPPADPARLPVDQTRAATIIDGATRERREHLTQLEALDLLEAYGVRTAKARLVTTAAELVPAANALGFPLVMKVVSPAIIHKTDVGGVMVGLKSESDVVAAYYTMMETVKSRAPGAKVTGVVVQQMLTNGRELIVGLTRDRGFGTLLMFGLGGVMVEALGDVVFRMVPIDDRQAHDMISGIRGTRLLDAMRGDPPVDRAALANVLRRVGQLGVDFPQLVEFDVNPLLAAAAGTIALDARARIELP
jgi:acetyltransferase